MENITPWELLALIFGGMLALCGAINTVGAAFERIAKARAIAKAPNAEQDKRLDDLERRVAVIEKKQGNDYRTFQDLQESTAVTQRALLALLGHGLHGNNVEAMTKSESELREYLTNHH